MGRGSLPFSFLRERGRTRRPVCVSLGRGGTGMPSRPCSRHGRTWRQRARGWISSSAVPPQFSMVVYRRRESLPHTPCFTGLPPRFLRHWRRSAPAPAGTLASLAKRSVLHHGQDKPFGDYLAGERPWCIAPPKRTCRGVRVSRKRCEGAGGRSCTMLVRRFPVLFQHSFAKQHMPC